MALLAGGSVIVSKFIELSNTEALARQLQDETAAAEADVSAAGDALAVAEISLTAARTNRDERKRLSDEAGVSALMGLGRASQADLDKLYATSSTWTKLWMDSLEAVKTAETRANSARADLADAQTRMSDRQVLVTAAHFGIGVAQSSLLWAVTIAGSVLLFLLAIAAAFWIVASRAAAEASA